MPVASRPPTMLHPDLLPEPTFPARALARLEWIARVTGLAGFVMLLRVLLGASRGEGSRGSHLPASLPAALGTLKGPFTKLGQLAAVRVDTLDAETRDALVSLRDDVPPLSFWRIGRVIEEELGAPLARHFLAIDPTPLGAASIAQVHRARLHDGRDVIVKVQYPWLTRSARADLALLRRLLKRLAPSERAGAAFAEFSRSYREELDFCREAAMAAEIAENLSGDPRLVVPQIVESHSAGRVLTMLELPALSLRAPEALAARGIPMPEVLQAIVAAYAKQMFVDGLFHADPHPGNLFVIDEPEATERPRILFVDFGLSQRLDPKLRKEVRQGIYALLKNDLDAFLAGMERMKMIEPGAEPGVRAAVSAMFERIRGEQGGAMAMSTDRVLALKDEASALLFETSGLTLPLPLLFYAKTLSYVFALGRELAPEVDLMTLAVPYMLRFLAETD
ncbi:MAG: AarF/ABC1/UbiB kinase family protein [bacterium]|nr:AarF/ABC1/UbiB kinase family protein [bacterium]